MLCQHCNGRPIASRIRLCATCYHEKHLRRRYQAIAERAEDRDEAPVANADALPCVGAPKCKAVVKVSIDHREERLRVNCPWVICAECVAAMAEVEG